MFILATLVLILAAALQQECDASEPISSTMLIVGGSTPEPGDWPWQVLLKKNGIFQCGGTLLRRRMTAGLKKNRAAKISSRYMVITAAHCVADVEATYTVVVGEHDRSVTSGFEQYLFVKTVVIHENYNVPRRRLENDLAILFLKKDPKLNEFVEPIRRLSTRKLDRKALKSDDCFVLGWGDTSEGLGKPTYSDILLELNTEILKKSECKKGLRKAGVDSERVIPSNICSDNTYGSFCDGDSGGTLSCEIDGIWTYVGVVSWTASGCVSPYPNVYTRVSKYRRWIRKIDLAEM